MADPRRDLLHGAIAAGGASTVMLSYAVNCTSDSDLQIVASECLEPLLRSVLAAIEAAGSMAGREDRAAIKDVVEDFLSRPKVGRPGRCRICGCTEDHACILGTHAGLPIGCAWADGTKTLCTNPDCLEAASAGYAPVTGAAAVAS